MENQDKLYGQFKDAAGRAEEKGFDRMEAVWNRVEEKLDNKKQRRIAAWWKYTGIAALFLLFLTIGTFMLNNEQNPVIAPKAVPENNISVIDTQKINEAFDPEKEMVTDAVVVTEAEKPVVNNKTPDSTTDSITFINGTRFSSSKDIENPKYSFLTRKDQPVKGTTDKAVTSLAAAEPSITADAIKSTNNGFITFSGTITDPMGPLPGATIIAEGTNNSVQTDMDGKFTINVKEGEGLITSFPGYQNKKITANVSNNNAYIILEENGILLESVAVDTYKSSKKVKATTAVTTLPIETIEDRVNATILPSLEGQVSGLIATSSGQPGSTDKVAFHKVDPLHTDPKTQFKNDLESNNLKIYTLGGFYRGDYETDVAFQKEYKLTYHSFGCTAPPNLNYYETYNLLVFDYLREKSSTKWEEKIREDALALQKWKERE